MLIYLCKREKMMIGVEILTWGTEKGGNVYYAPIYHYLWGGGNVGHAALKLTLPCNTENDDLIRQYCCNKKGKSLIPHYRIRNNSCWVVYFSWWPEQMLQEEHQDRLSANDTLHITYNKPWDSVFSKTMTSNSGILRSKSPKLYDWIFGKPASIPEPVNEIIHPSPNAPILIKERNEKKAALQNSQNILVLYLQQAERLLQLNFLAGIQHDFESKRYKATQKFLFQLKEEMQPAVKSYKVLAREYNEFCRQFYCDVAT
ncbi:MAG TPA: hypothetical protein PLD88_09815, partial [Candidatus Berkiella sp.]|nr:hypothetical protein [Candidatus Berkiella sp.]